MARIVRNIMLGLVLCLCLTGCKTELYTNLREDEANIVLAALLDEGLSAEKAAGEENLFSVMVEKSQFARAMAVLDQKGLPPKRHETLGTVFGKDAMFSTPMEEKARYLYAMQEELSHTLSEIDGVLSARVHLVLPEKDQMGKDLHVPSAAVFVKHVDDTRRDPASHRNEIRRLIAAAVPELAEDRIVVSFFPTAHSSPFRGNGMQPGGNLAGRLQSLPPEVIYGICAFVAIVAAAVLVLVFRWRGRTARSGAEKD